MARKIALGKKELSELGVSFIVANVPAFPIGTNNMYRMKVIEFQTEQEIIDNLGSIKNLVIFDDTGVYGEKLNKEIPGEQDIYTVRCVCDLSDKDLSIVKNNIKETTTQIFTFEWDFSNFSE